MEAQELLQIQFKHDPRMRRTAPGGGKFHVSAYAVRCHKHGRVALTWDEVFDRNLEQVSSLVRTPCPVCKTPCPQDKFWHEKMKEFLKEFLNEL